mmetsp:Transcript_25890/g.60475  ORF Transcript_25890/g.60475 Transcript_25890/m.60475 type:complete len:779 (-) Transcript_25890:99-2435(-)
MSPLRFNAAVTLLIATFAQVATTTRGQCMAPSGGSGPASCDEYSGDASPSSLSLLQRSALTLSKPMKPSIEEVFEDLELVTLFKERASNRMIKSVYYNDSDCTLLSGAERVESAETDACMMDWNLTCACDGDNKAMIAEHYFPSCSVREAFRSYRMPVGQCIPAQRLGSSSSLYVVIDDMASCPCCGANCIVYGDPHITVFDGNDVSLLAVNDHHPGKSHAVTHGDFRTGDFWLVKSELVYIQARYSKVKYTGTKEKFENRTYLTGLAVGGPFLQGNMLLIGPREGRVDWVNEAGETEQILQKPGFFKVEDLVEAHFREHGIRVTNRRKTAPGLFIRLPSGVKMEINRYKKHLDLSLTMNEESGGPGGVDGQCGNLNGDPRDDTAALISERVGFNIPASELLFAKETPAERSMLEVLHDADDKQEQLDKDVVAELLAYEAPTGPTVTVHIFEDSGCRAGLNHSHSSFSVAKGNCEVGWNFTCGCDGDYRQIIAEKRWPACDDPDAVRTYTLKADKCYSPDSKAGLVGGNYWKVDASQCPECCTDPKRCTVHGDPHITVFDQARVTLLLLQPAPTIHAEHGSEPSTGNSSTNTATQTTQVENQFGWGDYWLVRSEKVQIQARYRRVHYPGAKHLNHTYLTAFAVGGPFLGGSKFVVEPRFGEATWTFENGKSLQMFDAPGSVFNIDGLVQASYHNRSAIVPRNANDVYGVDLKLPSEVTLRVDRFSKHLDLDIAMLPEVGGPDGMDGQCGNYNGDPSDDTAELIQERMGYEVSAADSLF